MSNESNITKPTENLAKLEHEIDQKLEQKPDKQEQERLNIVINKVYKIVKDIKTADGTKHQVSKDFLIVLSNEVENLIKAACKRCIANGRKTLLPRDL